MDVNRKIMYHFHKNTKYNDIWVENNKIKIDENFKSDFIECLKKYSTAVNLDNNTRETFSATIDRYLSQDLDKSVYISMLKDASLIIKQINMLKREAILEHVREKYYPDLPSRSHSIWLCDKFQTWYWKDLLSDNNNKLTLLKLQVTGKMFQSSEAFLPKNESTYEQNIEEAHQYWNPKIETLEQEYKIEYLFQGRVKVLKKVID